MDIIQEKVEQATVEKIVQNDKLKGRKLEWFAMQKLNQRSILDFLCKIYRFRFEKIAHKKKS